MCNDFINLGNYGNEASTGFWNVLDFQNIILRLQEYFTDIKGTFQNCRELFRTQTTWIWFIPIKVPEINMNRLIINGEWIFHKYTLSWDIKFIILCFTQNKVALVLLIVKHKSDITSQNLVLYPGFKRLWITNKGKWEINFQDLIQSFYLDHFLQTNLSKEGITCIPKPFYRKVLTF